MHITEIFSLTHANTYAATTQGELDTTLGSKQRSWAEPAPGQRQGTTQQLNHNTLDLEPIIAPHVVTSTSQHCHGGGHYRRARCHPPTRPRRSPCVHCGAPGCPHSVPPNTRGRGAPTRTFLY